MPVHTADIGADRREGGTSAHAGARSSSGAGAAERIRIAYLLGSLEFGGAERHMVHLLERLDRTRFDPTLFLTRMQGPYLPAVRELGVAIEDAGIRSVFTPAGLAGIGRLSARMRALRIELVHSYLYASNLIGLGLAALDPDLLHLIAIRQLELPHPQVFRPLFRWAEGPRTHFVSVSAASDEILGRWGISPRRRHRVANGVALPGPADPARSAALRRETDTPEDALVVLMVANFNHMKGHRTLVRAFAALAERPPAVLWLAGKGALLEETRRLAASLRVDGRIRFLGSRADVPDLLQASDVFVLNSREEGMSNALLEAVAAGLPCIATRVGGNPEVVEDGGNGFLVPRDDVAALAAALGRLLASPDRRRAMGASSRCRAELEFGLDAMARATERVYEAALSENRPSRAISAS